MSALRYVVRPGAYRDSIVLLGLRAALAELPGVLDAAAVMASPENLALLAEGGLLPDDAAGLSPSDLLVAVRGESDAAAEAALTRIDALLVRPPAEGEEEFRPRSLASAFRQRPGARWALVSVPGRYAARVAGEALAAGRHVFLFSDHVPLAEEVSLKRQAAAAGLLVMGPDCGTALVSGVGFGFANRVRRGPIGIVAASGTGLQAVSCLVHRLGSGVSHALGTGSRDLGAEVGGISTIQGLDLLRRDPDTGAIVLLSKPPAPEVAARVLEAAARAGKPVVVCYQGAPPSPTGPGVQLAATLRETAELAVAAAGGPPAAVVAPAPGSGSGEPAREPRTARRGLSGPVPGGRGLLGLFAGGTLALEALLTTRTARRTVASNLPLEGVRPGTGEAGSHLILDLGADEFTAGRLHPMMDGSERLARLRAAAGDPGVGVVLLDVVLGHGAHPDPGRELAPAIETLMRSGREAAVVLVGTDEDPQHAGRQAAKLEAAGARVFRDAAEAARWALARLGDPPAARMEEAARSAGTDGEEAGRAGGPGAEIFRPVPLEDLAAPIEAANVGLEVFHSALLEQGAQAVQVEWRPPAGGDERLSALLDRMRG